MGHVRETALRQLYERRRGERLDRLADAAAGTEPVGLVRGVVDEIVVLELDEDDVMDRDEPDARGRGNRDALVPVASHCAHRPVHAHGEVGVPAGLDHEVERVHLIARDRVLREVGHEDEGRHRIARAQLLGGLHAVDARKVDVHEDEVRVVLLGDELDGASQTRDLEVDSVVRGVPVKMPGDCRGLLVGIVDDENPVRFHGVTPSTVSYQSSPVCRWRRFALAG